MYSLTPESYNTVIHNLTPLEVKVESLEFRVVTRGSGLLMSMAKMRAPALESVVEASSDSWLADISQACQFAITQTDSQVVASGSAMLSVRLKLGIDPPEEFWDVFLERNIKLYTQPVLRDLVSTLAMRAGLLAQPIGSVSVVQSISGDNQIALPATIE
jgi:hypothetical protein